MSQTPAPSNRSFPPGVGWLTIAALVAIVAVASIIQIVPRFGPAGPVAAVNQGTGTSGAGDQPGAGAAGPSGAAVAGANPAAGGGAAKPGAQAAAGQGSSGQSCSSSGNGGATDVGVSSKSIKLASTIVNSGVGQSFLGPVQYGMQAVVNRINRAGGICGRILSLTLVDDGWDAVRGCNDIQSFINDSKVFALPVVPSSEGLKQCVDSGVIHQAGVPVIGTDGMLFDQYEASGNADWVWPVAASTLSTMHIMVEDAMKNHGAKTFCLVYDNLYHFGSEGHAAFDGEVSRLGGKDVYDEGLDPNAGDYSTDVQNWNNNCSNVDFVGMLLEPDEAARWLGDNPNLSTPKSKAGVAGAQPMFSNSLTANCGDICDGIKVYTGYRPIVDPAYSNLPSVVQYANDVQSVSSQADLTNQFLEGGYDGMLLLVDALKAVGPHLTRDAIRDYLNSATFAADGSGLTQPLHWKAGNHFANIEMKAYAMVASSGRVTGYRPDPAGFIADPAVGADAPQS